MSISETFTDNVGAAGGGKRAERVTQLTPGILIRGTTSRLTTYADYQVSSTDYARGSSGNRVLNALNAVGKLEAIPSFLFVDFSGVISRQTISAFGAQQVSDTSLSGNSTETATYRVSPSIRGRLFGVAEYSLSVSHTDTRAASQLATQSVSDAVSAELRGNTQLAALSWSLSGNHQEVRYGGAHSSISDQLLAKLTYKVNPQFAVSGNVGTESNNYTTNSSQSYANSGYGFEWTPTERTKVAFSRDKRSFGFGHNITVSHRLPLTAIQFTDVKSVVAQPGVPTTYSRGTYYDLLYNQLASQIPDPVQRDLAVRAQLQQAGIAANSPVTGGFLASRVTVSRRQELSLVINGLRNVVTYTFFQSQTDTLGVAPVGIDDFATVSAISQRGMSSNFSHRLSPTSSFNSLGTWSRSSSIGGPTTSQRTLTLGITTSLGRRLGASLNYRGVRGEGLNAFNENAVIGTLTAQF